MTDDQFESLIEASDGHFVDDEFRITGKDLMNLLRAVQCEALNEAAQMFEALGKDLAASQVRALKDRPCT